MPTLPLTEGSAVLISQRRVADFTVNGKVDGVYTLAAAPQAAGKESVQAGLVHERRLAGVAQKFSVNGKLGGLVRFRHHIANRAYRCRLCG